MSPAVLRVRRHWVAAWGQGFRLGLGYGAIAGAAVMAAVYQIATFLALS